MSEIEEMSASALKKYSECEKQYWYKYLSNIEPPEEEEPEFFATGNCVHDTIEFVLKEYPDELSDEENLYDLLDEESHNFDNDNQDNDTVDNCFRTASRWISSFVDDVNHVEEKWSMDKNEIEYRGLADLVADIEQDGAVFEDTIIDWKTGGVQEEWKERVQAGVYIEMFYDKFGHYPDAAVFVYLDEETQSLHPRIQDGRVYWNEQENKYWTEIESIQNQILYSNQQGEWEAKPEQSKCYFCQYRLHCEDSGVGAEKVEPRHINIGDIL